MTTKSDIGEGVKSVRRKAGLTQSQLAKKLRNPVRKETISRLERGNSNFGIDLLFDIANVLNVDIAIFCPGPERKKALDIFEEALSLVIEKHAKKKAG